MWISRAEYNIMKEQIANLEAEKIELLNNCLQKELEINELEEITRTFKTEKIPTKRKTITKKTIKKSKKEN